MTTLDPRALKEAARVKCRQDEEQMLLPDWGDLDDDQQDALRGEAAEIIAAYLAAALPHLTTEDLRDTPAGRALVAQGKSLGWDDAIGELRKGQGLHRALAGTLSTRKPNYEETTNDHA